MPFHGYVSAALVSGTASAQVSPSGLAGIAPRVLVEADTWAHFRVRSLALRLHRNNATTGAQAIGFVGGVQDTLPSTVAQISELLSSAICGDQLTVPGEWVRPRAEELAGPFPWYKSVNGAADGTEEGPGYIVIAGNTTEVYSYEVRGVIEFKTAISTSNTPAEVRLLGQLRALRLAQTQARNRAAVTRLLTGPPVALPSVTLAGSTCP